MIALGLAASGFQDGERGLLFAASASLGPEGDTCSADFASNEVCCYQPEAANDYEGHVQGCKDVDFPFCQGYEANKRMGTCTAAVTASLTCEGYDWASVPYCSVEPAADCCVPDHSSQHCSDYSQHVGGKYFSGTTIHAQDDKQMGAVFPICAERHCAAGALDYSVCHGSFRAAPGDCAGNDKDYLVGYDLHACAAACVNDNACAGFSILGTHCITKTESCTEAQSSSWTFWVRVGGPPDSPDPNSILPNQILFF